MPAFDQPAVCNPHVLLSVETQVAKTNAPFVTVVIPVTVTSKDPPGAPKLAFVCATSIAQVLDPEVGRKTCITTVVFAEVLKDTLGFVDQVPLKRAQKILCDAFVVLAV